MDPVRRSGGLCGAAPGRWACSPEPSGASGPEDGDTVADLITLLRHKSWMRGKEYRDRFFPSISPKSTARSPRQFHGFAARGQTELTTRAVAGNRRRTTWNRSYDMHTRCGRRWDRRREGTRSNRRNPDPPPALRDPAGPRLRLSTPASPRARSEGLPPPPPLRDRGCTAADDGEAPVASDTETRTFFPNPNSADRSVRVRGVVYRKEVDSKRTCRVQSSFAHGGEQ